MSNREQEAWGGEVRLPRWLRRMLRRPEPLGDSPEGAHEARKPATSEQQKFDHMRATGTVAPHHSELPRPDSKRRR